jgi:SPP1 gp7 family putative phage head morphogenesis protein
MTFYQTSGKSVKALSMDDVFGVGFESNLNSTSSDSSPRNLYTLVPFVRRAVRLRMNAIASVPVTLQKADTDLSTRPEWQGLMKNLPTALAKVEMALCLSPYGAYWRKNTNKLGLNPTPEWLLPQSVWPYITADEGLRYFRYVHPWGTERAGIVENLTPDQVVAFWYPSLDRASWPGSPPGVTAQPAGTALNAQDVFIASYFRRGAIKAVLLQVPPDAKPADRDRLTAWWRSIVGGVSNAWKSVVVQTNVTPVVIGDGLKEMNNESLTRQYRQDVAAAFDIPETMLMQGAANYATAKIDRIGFYEETIFPEHQMILGCINQQWLQPAYGAELVAHPEQTEARQDAQLSQAQALTELVGQPILTVDEGRAWIGFEPMAESAKPVDDSAEFDQMAQEASQVDQSESEHELTTMGAAGKTAQIMGYHIEAGVVSRNEARAGLGLAPEDESSDQHLRKLQIALSVAKAAIEAGYSPADAQRLVGLPEGMSATPTPNELKRYAHDLPTGMYIQLPGSDSRKAERSSLLQSHSATRKAVQDRHSLERKQVRDTHAQARQTATDARERLKATTRHAAEMQMLAQRQTAERTMLASLHTAERSRLTDRHAAQRSHEVATLRGQGAVKATDPTPDDPDVQRLANALRQYLRGEYKTASEAIAAMPEGILSKAAADQLPLDTGEKIQVILRKFYPLFVKAGWQAGADQIGVDLAFDLENPFVQQTLDSLASAIVGVSDTTRDEIRALVGKQASEGWDMATLAAMIATRADAIAPERALTIARTESASAQSQGSILSWQASGVVDRVTWLTSDPCPICAPLDGKTVAIGQPFAPGVMHPPAHPNCRCALAAAVSEATP